MGSTVKLCSRRNVIGCTGEFGFGFKLGTGDKFTLVVAFAVSFVCSSEGFCTT